jgi:hypothetical protein
VILGYIWKGFSRERHLIPVVWGGESALGRERCRFNLRWLNLEESLYGTQQVTPDTSIWSELEEIPQKMDDAIIRELGCCTIIRGGGSAANMDLRSVSLREAFESKLPRNWPETALASEHSTADTS